MNKSITREEIPTSFACFRVWTAALIATTIFEISVYSTLNPVQTTSIIDITEQYLSIVLYDYLTQDKTRVL